jgi:hypothetical protein
MAFLRNGNLDLGDVRSTGCGLRAKERRQLLADGRANPGAGVRTPRGAEEPVVACDDVGEARLVEPELRRGKPLWRRKTELAAESGEKSCIQRSDRACSAKSKGLAVDDDVVAPVRISVGGDVRDHPSGSMGRPGLPKRRAARAWFARS